MPNLPCPHCGEQLTAREVRSLVGRLTSAMGPKPGRAPKLSPEERTAALAEVAAGATVASVARRYGVHESTIWRMKRNA